MEYRKPKRIFEDFGTVNPGNLAAKWGGDMSSVRIVIRKSKKKLYVYRNGKEIYRAKAVHGQRLTSNGKRRLLRWYWGAISSRYEPNTWFSYGATFKGWPAPGREGDISKWGKKWKVRRISLDRGDIMYKGNWYSIWKDMNPFGVVMADLEPGKIELHGTGKDPSGRDDFPPVTHGCVRTYNKDILKIKALAPLGTEVEITD